MSDAAPTDNSHEPVVGPEGVYDVDESGEASPNASAITYYGTDFDVEGLVRRLDRGDIIIPTFDPEVESSSDIAGFQRRFVWRKPQMDRFIESLLLGFPVPGVFLVQEPNNSLLVLDGQQRLRTLSAFYRGLLRGSEFKLQNVLDDFKDATYEKLDGEDRRKLDNTFIHATIVKRDAGDDNVDAIYQLFERLNTGGTNLVPQEIRVALFNGPFIAYIRQLNNYEAWRELYGNRSERLKDQELLLRFFALLRNGSNYQRPLKTFLNDFAETFRDMDGWDADANAALFKTTTDLILEWIGKPAFRLQRVVNAALVDALMVGVASMVESGEHPSREEFVQAYEGLLKDVDFLAAVTRATADEDSVATRLAKARAAFNSVA